MIHVSIQEGPIFPQLADASQDRYIKATSRFSNLGSIWKPVIQASTLLVHGGEIMKINDKLIKFTSQCCMDCTLAFK